MSPSFWQRTVTVRGALVGLVLGFVLLVAAVGLLLGRVPAQWLLAYGGCGLLLALGEILFALAVERWFTPAIAARLCLVVYPVLAFLCVGFVRLVEPRSGPGDALVLGFVGYAAWTTWRTWRALRRLARMGPPGHAG